MACKRCRAASERAWCPQCERAFDTWVRRYASDMIVPVVAGMIIVATFGVALPLLGVGWLVGGVGAFVGFGTLAGVARVTKWRRRRQFLQLLPRAALLPAKQ